jgi:phosphatidylglycerophosphatase A
VFSFSKKRNILRAMMSNFAMKLATLFGLGKIPIMPGTIGSLCGVLFHGAIVQNLRPPQAIFLTIFLILVAVVSCDVAEKKIGEKDPRCIILDEFVAMPICFFGIKHLAEAKFSTFAILLMGFVIFRIFDILKPLGIERVQNLSGGIGIVADDIVAAIYANITLAVICLTVR